MATPCRELMADAGGLYHGPQLCRHGRRGRGGGRLLRAARKQGKTARIVIDLERNAARPLLAALRPCRSTRTSFSPAARPFAASSGALLVVVDTSRPDMVESHQVLESCNRVAVIDHHRRSASYIENAAFSFHEPYASSASELVTELLQYLVEPWTFCGRRRRRFWRASCWTRSTSPSSTGGRTFEAAAFLRRAGADTASVQRLFQSDLQDMVTRYDIIRRADLYRENIALSVIPEDGVDRVAAAQAADELLTLKGVQASFVLYRSGEDVLMSARSLGDINVQVILEALGGGGIPPPPAGGWSMATFPPSRRGWWTPSTPILKNNKGARHP